MAQRLLALLALPAVAVLAHGDHMPEEEVAEAATTCGAINDSSEYDQSIHIAAIFVVFGVSIVGSMVPVLSSYLSCLKSSRTVLSLLNSFGFGVVIATAFIHMIPPAVDTLNDPCLDVGYSGLAMALVVATVFTMQALETELVLLLDSPPSNGHVDRESGLAVLKSRQSRGSTPSMLGVHLNDNDQHNHHHHHHHAHSSGGSNDNMRKKINVLIFEIGVAIHSVIIGLNLGVATGPSFSTLLVAISFHQFFEGVAVGSSAVTAFSNIRTSIMTAIGFSFTTPLGIALGVAINSTYSETSTTSLWTRGVLDAIAGGILVYTGIVELLTYQYTINSEFHSKSGGLRSLHYLFLWLGAAAMAIVGYWA
ncbi:hypothetical protein DYB32_007733 [Aphanomyces invadans]|uniref:Zinc/iron permease n=1 Tax=Aphanomyces invadans TaxID=157072 RepID=A0A418AN57_9STRA|nr:hypothetical protein DYB32_007733 [Aphanomyces invadans]